MADALLLGESIATSTGAIQIQTAAIGQVPPLGAVVAVDGVLAVVISAETGPIDSARRTVALGLDGEDVRDSHPELASLIRSTFTLRPVADKDGLPPRIPAALHVPVRAANPEELAALSADFRHLALLADQPAALLAQHILQLAGNDRSALVRAGGALARELTRDADKLRVVLGTIERASGS
jgi:hypothetical protein